MTLENTLKKESFGGIQSVFKHDSTCCGGPMEFGVYVPPGKGPFPVVYFLSGLTCTWANFTEKAGAQRVAAELGLILVMPDTSPRGAGYDGEDDAYDFGSGAGFYVDATEKPWSARYNMYTYVTKELPAIIDANFPTLGPSQRSIFGHSMGGHGALVIGLREPESWKSISAFSPICAPSRVPWGRKAFTGYLGEDKDSWGAYDACELVQKSQHPAPILIDQGEDDNFLAEQLRPELFEATCKASDQAVTLRMHDGYDHSYYFIASFVEDHLRHHAKYLG